MKPILMMLAACAALLFALPVEAGKSGVCCPQAVIVGSAPIVLQPQPMVLLNPQPLLVLKPQPVEIVNPPAVAVGAVLAYEQRTRKLRLGERIGNNIRQRQANRSQRVTEWKPITQSVAFVTAPAKLGLVSEESPE